jgi:hypothetical protein
MFTNWSKVIKNRFDLERLSSRSKRLRILFISGISTGAYAALISWIQGYQYTRVGWDSHHQIMTYPTLRGSIIVHLTTRASVALERYNTKTGASTRTLRFVKKQWWLPLLFNYVLVFGAGLPAFCITHLKDTLVSLKMSVLSRILRENGIVTKDDYVPPTGSKGDQETFRRGRTGPRRNSPKEQIFRSWNSRRSYREHPYWTTNLKYVY